MGKKAGSRGEWERKKYAEDPDYRRKKLAYSCAYAVLHKAEINARRRHRWKSNPELREKKRAARYGISPEDYKVIAARQRGACAICKKKPSHALFVDHCHSTGKVRGLLCRECNSGLGFYEDKPSLLRAAAAYLESFRDDGPAS